jgi:glutamine amidotransferase-like uncharacterized protein
MKRHRFPPLFLYFVLFLAQCLATISSGAPPPPTINSPGSTTSPGPVESDLTPTFTWNSVSGATGYALYIRDLTTNTLIFNNNGGPKTGTSYTLPSGYLSNNGHAFRWAMASIDGTGESGQSSYRYFQTPSTATIPPPPTINSPGSTTSPGPVESDLTPTFTWNSVSGATGYALYIRDLTTNTLIFNNDGGTKTGTSYTLPSGYLTNNGHAFRWAMASINSAGESGQSSYRYFQTPSTTTVPNPPTINSPGSTTSPGPVESDLTPTFTWNSVSGATGYALYIRDLTTNTLIFNNDGGPKTGTSYTLPSGYLSNNGHAFRWAMASINSAGESGQSSYRYFQTPSTATVPPPPTINSPGSTTSPGPVESDLTPTFTWNSVSGATGYALYIRDLTTNTLIFNNDGGPKTGTSFTLPSGYLSNNGHAFRWAMASINSAGESGQSSYRHFQTPSETPPLSITTTAFNPSTATVGTGYAAQSAVMATGGQTPYLWSATGFPNGMAINSSTAAPFGTPTVAGTFNVTVTVQDSSNPQKTASRTLTLTVSDGGSTPTLSITTTAFNPPTATVGVGYGANSAVTATGGQVPYAWSATGFPNGMSINSSNGAPFGTPTVAGTFNVTVTVRDSSSPQKTASKVLPLTVNAVDTAGPVIANVSPNPVIGSTSSQPFTISGANFSSTSVVNLYNLTTGTPYLNRTVNSHTNNRLVINPNFGTEAHNWSVEVVNGTLSSGQFQFSVQTPITTPRADLIPSNVDVNPSSVQIGNSISVSVTIFNQGPANAIASTTRVRINTSTTGTSSADLALGDIATPAIPAGTSAVVSGSFAIPGGGTVGTNYIWVSLDNNSVTNQSDTTNDYAQSPAVTVTASTVAKPVIESLSGDQVIDHDQVAVLSVVASGPGTLTYQWKRNDRPIPGATPSSIRTNQAGIYRVEVSNSGGTTPSNTITITVNPFSNPPPPGTGSLTSFGGFNSVRPTVVITHGWQPIGDYNPNGVDWQIQMAQAIKNRFPNHEINTLIFAWPEAYTVNWADARSSTASEGNHLAAALQNFLGSDYQEKIQFVGHSYGTFVNAFAVNKIKHHVDHVSLLDSPIDIRFGSRSLYRNDVLFRLLLPKTRVDYVDSYIADEPFYGLNFGGFITGAAPNGGLHLATNHSGTYCYYINTVGGSCQPAPNTTEFGFNSSALLSAGERQSINRWDPPLITSEVVSQFSDAPSSTSGDVAADVDIVQGTTSNVFRLRTSGSASTSRPVADQATPVTGDSAVEFEVTVPADAEYLRFSFLFSQLGDGDWMTVTLGDQVIFSFLGRSFLGANYDEAVIPISTFAGQTGVVKVLLHAASSATTELRVANLRFESGFIAASGLGNISTRLSVGIGDNAMIGGFIITGTQPKTVIVRGIGPSLNLEGKLANPTLSLYQDNVLLESNDDWQQSPNKQAIIDSGVPPMNDFESAIVAILPANNSGYTAILRGANNGTGIGVVEVYDLNQTVDSRLANISTRGFVGTGDNVMIGGTIITGAAATNVMVRAIGPSLTGFGITNALEDPALELHDAQGGIIAINDNWIDSPDAAAISAIKLQPSDNRESAILQILAPGQYTAIVRGNDNSIGVALVEAYQLQ